MLLAAISVGAKISPQGQAEAAFETVGMPSYEIAYPIALSPLSLHPCILANIGM
jgi:hypothetical protein